SDFVPAFGAHIKEQKAVPENGGENHHGPKDDKRIAHKVASAAETLAGGEVSSEPTIMPIKASPNDEAPATSGLICLALGTSSLTMRNVIGPTAPSTSAA